MKNKRMQLFIFPYAGGSRSSFRKLEEEIDESIEVITIEYAGRGTRAKEPLLGSFDEMFNDAVKYASVRRDKQVSYAVMGYSMGALLAYEALVADVFRAPAKHLIIAAEVPPHIRAFSMRQEDEITEETILNRATALGGLDQRMLGNKRFKDIYIKPMISDFRHFFEYRYQHKDVMLYVDTELFYCEKDTAFIDMKKWEELLEGRCDYYEFGNGHFFINQYYTEIAGIINKTLMEKC